MAEEKILIIEDEQDIALMMDTLMQECGYHTVIVHDGLSGLHLALQERPDLILLDMRLPQMSGMQLLYKLHEHQINVPVVVVTAWGSEELAVQALRMGVKDYIRKPFNLNELLEVVERALEGSRLRRERDRLTEQLLTSNQQLKQRVRQLTALYEVGQALTSTLDLDELLNVILQEARRVLEVNVASILLLDEQSGELVFRSGTGGGAERLLGLRLAPGQGVAGWVAQHGEPLLTRDAQSDARFHPEFDQITGFTTESILCVPLVVKGRIIGVLEALNKPQAGFTQDDLALLRSMATSAAVAIENSQLFDETRQQLRQSNVLFRLGKQLTALLPLRRLLQVVVNGAIELIPQADRSIIYLHERSSDALRAGASSTAELSAWDVLWEPAIKRRIIERALREQRTMTAQIHQGNAASANEFAAPYTWIVAVPLRVQEENLGVLTVDSQDGRAFTSQERHTLATFANQAAIAIKNARLHRQTEVQLVQMTRSYGEIRALQEITGALLSSLDLPEVLDQIVQSVVSGLGYNAAMLAAYDEHVNSLSVQAVAADPSLVEAAEGLVGLRVLETGITLDQTENLAVRAALAGKMELTHHLYDLFRPWVTQEIAEIVQAAAGIHTLATIPLRAKGQLVGNLFAGSSKNKLSRTDLHSLQILANHAAIAIENARLYQDLRDSRDQVAERGETLEKRVNELVRLQQIALELGELTIGADLRDVYQRLTKQAATLLEVTSSAILLFDPDRQELVCQHPAFGVPREIIRNYRIPLNPASPVWEVWEKGQPLAINDVSESSLVKALGLQELASQKGLRSTMFSILRMGGRSIGVFQVSDKRDGSGFTPNDERVLEIFASQSAIAIENARLFTREKHRASEMETLVGIAQAVTEAVTERPQSLLEHIARGACEVLRADCAVVCPFVATEPDTYDVSNVATFGTVHPLELSRKPPANDPVHLIRKRNLLACGDLAHEQPALAQAPFFSQESIRAFVGVLLQADEEELGTLYVSFRAPHHFEEHELTSVRLIAHQAALAIAKSRLFETLNQDLLQSNAELLRKLREMEQLQKISNMIGSTLEIDKVFDGILQGAMSVTGAPYANIMTIDEESGAIISHVRCEGQTTTERIDPREVVEVPSIAEEERSAVVSDVTAPSAGETSWTGIYRRLLPKARSVTFTPIIGGGEQKRIGLLGISSPRPGEFGPDDRRLLEALSNQAAIAIQNARYLQAVRGLQEQQVEAERIAAIADVAANMVHRINNNVGAIRPLIQQIELRLAHSQLDEGYLQEKLNGIRQSADHTLAVARQIRRPFQDTPLQSIDVNESIVAAWADLKTPVGVQVKFEYGENLPPVEATQQLDEVFRNLMKNALDAMAPQGGLLLVRSHCKGSRLVEVMVKDTGPGIPPELREKIFRVGTTTKPGGMGYGLWWSRMFLRRLGGDMVLEPQDDRGCTFKVTLPISKT